MVRYRAANEEIIDYLNNAVKPAMSEAHKKASPNCTSGRCDLWMPISEGADGVGLRTIN